MPVLKNPRHERFARELAKGKSATEAYVSAGYKHSANARSSASVLQANPNISQRVEKLQGKIAARVVEQTAVTRADILEELKKIVFATFEDGSVKANDKRAACIDYARIEGWIVERHEHGVAGEFEERLKAIRAMAPDERKRAAADVVKRLAEAGVFDGADRRGPAKD